MHATGAACTLRLLAILCAVAAARCQEYSPFIAQGIRTEDSLNYTVVYASAYLDRLLYVDDAKYQFQVIMYVVFSWEDSAAVEHVQNRTAEAGPTFDNPSTCQQSCFQGGVLCCDTVWLPGFNFRNVVGAPQDRVIYSTISVGGGNGTAAFWLARVQLTMYTPMDLRSFPFDKQVLFLYGQAHREEAVGNNHLYRRSQVASHLEAIPSGSNKGSSNLTTRSDGLSGWNVENVSMEISWYNTSLLFEGAVTLSAASPGQDWTAAEQNNPDYSPRDYPADIGDIVIITITVCRLASFYFWNMLIPMALVVGISWFAFLLHPSEVATRLGTGVTCFLTLTALQFVINSQLPISSYLTIMDILILVSYFVITFVIIESAVAYQLWRQVDSRRLSMSREQRSSLTASGSHGGDGGSTLGCIPEGKEDTLDDGEGDGEEANAPDEQVEEPKEERSLFKKCKASLKFVGPLHFFHVLRSAEHGGARKLGRYLDCVCIIVVPIAYTLTFALVIVLRKSDCPFSQSSVNQFTG